MHEELNRLGFARYVFGIQTAGKRRAEVMDELLGRYTRALDAHRADRVLDAAEPAPE